MKYIKSQLEQKDDISPIYGWGKATRYIEFDKDLIPLRHVDHFENGNILHYHEDHYFDVFEMLANPQFDGSTLNAWWGNEYENIDEEEFLKAWAKSALPEIAKRQKETKNLLLGKEKCPYRELYLKRREEDPMWLT
jgi:hypothetical protein